MVNLHFRLEPTENNRHALNGGPLNAGPSSQRVVASVRLDVLTSCGLPTVSLVLASPSPGFTMDDGEIWLGSIIQPKGQCECG
jgi:hypothetical protein